MAKNMAKIENGIVVNIEWCSDRQPETESLKSYDGYTIRTGDTYSEGKFWRDGEKVLSELEAAQQEVAALTARNSELEAAMLQMVESVYNEDKGAVATCTSA